MNVAENIRDSGLIELHELCCAAFIESQIKAFSVEQREHVMKKRIAIREFHLASSRYHHQRGMEGFVLLYDLRNVRGPLLRHSWIRRIPQRREPNHHFGCVADPPSISGKLYLPFEFHILRHCKRAQRD